MKISILCISILLSISFASAQSFNTQTTTSEEQPVLLGKINKEGLSGDAFESWFTTNYNSYVPEKESVHLLKNKLSEYTITAFMGTWCGDSKKEVPTFYKTLEAADFPLDRLTMVAVARDREAYKQSPGGEEEGLNIHRVPTFILYKDGKEVNRIVEHPIISIEKDMLNILKGNYTSNYQSVHTVHAALNEMGVEKFQKKRKKLAKQLKPITTTMYELNTYSNVLLTAGKTEEAIVVARLNLILFPDEIRAQESLKNKISIINSTK